jgi:hypothetical protein
MTKAAHIDIYRNALNEGQLTYREFEAFMHAIDAQHAANEEARKHALAHLRK